MYQQQSLQKAELSDGKIGCVDSLSALATRNPNSNLRLLNHGHIIGTVADGQRHGLRRDARSDQTHHPGLLQRGHAAGDDHLALSRHLQEGPPQIELGHSLKRGTSDHHRGLLAARNSSVEGDLHALEFGSQLLGANFGIHVQDHHLHLVAEHLGTVANVPSRLQLVPGQHPQLDAGFADLHDGLRDIILKLVLDACRTDDFHAGLQVLGHLRELRLAVLHGVLGTLVVRVPLREIVLADTAAAEDQCPETLLCKLREVLLERRLGTAAALEHHVVGAFDEHKVLAAGATHDDGHALPSRGEGIDCEDCVLQALGRPIGPGDLDGQGLPRAGTEVPAETPRGFHQSALIGALRLELDVAPGVLCDHHGVRDGEDLQEVVNRRCSAGVQQHGRAQRFRAVEARIGGDLSEDTAGNRDPLEFHDILRQRSRLVGEDVGHLAKLVAEVGGAHGRRAVLLFVVHLEVASDEVGLAHIAHFHRRIQGDGHEIAIQDEEGEPIAKPIRQDDVANHTWVGEEVPVTVEGCLRDVEHHVAEKCQNRLCGEDDEHGPVHDTLQIGELHGGLGGVLHHPRVPACVHDNSEDPGSVLQLRSAEKQMISTKWLLRRLLCLCAAGHGHGSREVVDGLRGVLGLDGSFQRR
mmetsp:Transcript_17807/g.62487  ORF Transcript_17807/g.62487 Transcript_17807/m.62487 type:complete len:637 (+) Transcript_17807:2623-4533(+)